MHLILLIFYTYSLIIFQILLTTNQWLTSFSWPCPSNGYFSLIHPHIFFPHYAVPIIPGPRQCGEVPDIVWPDADQKALPPDLYPHPGGTALLLHARPGQRGLPHHDSAARGDGICHRRPQTASVWPHRQKPGEQESPQAPTQEVKKSQGELKLEWTKTWHTCTDSFPTGGSGLRLRPCLSACVFRPVFIVLLTGFGCPWEKACYSTLLPWLFSLQQNLNKVLLLLFVIILTFL